MLIGIRNLFHAGKPFFCVFCQYKRRIKQNCSRDRIPVIRRRYGGNGSALAGSQQKDMVRVHILQILHHGKYGLQILLLGKNRHFILGAVAPASRTSAAEVEAVYHIPSGCHRLRILLPRTVRAAEPMGINHGRHHLSRIPGNINDSINPVIFAFCVQLLHIKFINGLIRHLRHGSLRF